MSTFGYDLKLLTCFNKNIEITRNQHIFKNSYLFQKKKLIHVLGNSCKNLKKICSDIHLYEIVLLGQKCTLHAILFQSNAIGLFDLVCTLLRYAKTLKTSFSRLFGNNSSFLLKCWIFYLGFNFNDNKIFVPFKTIK